MNTNGMEIFLTAGVAGIVSLLLFVYLKRFFYLLKTSNQAQPSKNGKSFNDTNSNLKNQRKKIESKPNVVCSLPIHQVSRREMRLY